MSERLEIITKQEFAVSCALGDVGYARDTFYDIGIHNLIVGEVISVIPTEDGGFTRVNYGRIQGSCLPEELGVIACAMEKAGLPFELEKVRDEYYAD